MQRTLVSRILAPFRRAFRAVAFGARFALAGMFGRTMPALPQYRMGPYGVESLPAARGGTIPGYEQREGYYRVLLDWTPDDLRTAVYTSSTGWLTLAGDLCTAMRGDDRIPPVIAARVMAVQGAPLTFEAAPSGRLRRRALKAAQAEEDWWEILPEAELEELRSWLRFFGVALGELVWVEPDPADSTGEAVIARLRNGRNVPRLKVWDPRNLRKDLDTGLWYVRTRDGTEEQIRPGKGKWVLLTLGGSRPWLKAPWRGVAELWLAKKYAREDWARQSERYADGTFWVSSPDESEKEERDALAADIDKAGKRPVFVAPPGYEAEVLEINAQAWLTYQSQWEICNRSIAIAILYNDLGTESKTSAGTGAQLQGDVRDDLKKADASSDETALRSQVLAPWAEANFGDPELAPWPMYDVDPPEDLNALATMWSGVALAMKNFRDARVALDLDEVRELTGIPITGEIEVQPVPAALVQGAQPVPGQPGKPGQPAPGQAPQGQPANDTAEQVESLAPKLGLRNALDITARTLGAPLSPSELHALARMPAVLASRELAALFTDRTVERQRAVRRALSIRGAREARLGAQASAERIAA